MRRFIGWSCAVGLALLSACDRTAGLPAAGSLVFGSPGAALADTVALGHGRSRSVSSTILAFHGRRKPLGPSMPMAARSAASSPATFSMVSLIGGTRSLAGSYRAIRS